MQGMSVKAAIAESAPVSYQAPQVGLGTRLFRLVAGLVLTLLFFLTAVTLFQRVADREFLWGFYRSPEFLWFSVGGTFIGMWFLSGIWRRPLLLAYVLGHEMTHAIFVYCFLGWVSGFRFGPTGGYILTNRSNIVIALSPYCFPFWSVLGIGSFVVVDRFLPIPHREAMLLVLVGMTWTFHIIWTLWMIPRDQPDLQENGTLFSLTVIFLANTALLAAMFIMASGSLTWRMFFYNWANNLLHFAEKLESWI